MTIFEDGKSIYVEGKTYYHKHLTMNYFSYRLSLLKYKGETAKKLKDLNKKFSDGIRAGAEDSITRSLNDDIFGTSLELEENIVYLKTRYLSSIAEKKSLPMPSRDEDEGYWYQGIFSQDVLLTNKGITEIRSLIRKERKEKFELVAQWVTILIGLIGAITGLVAVSKK